MICRKCGFFGRSSNEFSGLVTFLGSIASCKRCGALNVTGFATYVFAILCAVAIGLVAPYVNGQKTIFGSGGSQTQPQVAVSPRSESTDRPALSLTTPKAVIQDVPRSNQQQRSPEPVPVTEERPSARLETRKASAETSDYAQRIHASCTDTLARLAPTIEVSEQNTARDERQAGYCSCLVDAIVPTNGPISVATRSSFDSIISDFDSQNKIRNVVLEEFYPGVWFSCIRKVNARR